MTLAQTGAAIAAAPNRKQRRQAERNARRTRAGGGGGGGAPMELAKQHHLAGRLNEAEAAYRQAVESGDSQGSALLGALCLQQGRTEEAVGHLELASTRLPEQVSNHTNLGLAYNMLERKEDADGAFERALALQPQDPEARKNIAGWLFQRQRYAEAIPLLEAALAQASKDAKRWDMLAQSHGSLGHQKQALEAAEKARGLEPENVRYNAYCGILLAINGRYEEALQPMLIGFPAMGQNQEYQNNFLSVLACTSYKTYKPEMEQALLICFETGLLEVQRLASTTGTHIWLRYMQTAQTQATEDGKGVRVHFAGMLADELLIQLLSRTVNKFIGLEALLVPMRATLLASIRQQPDVSPTVMRFVAAFAMQCHNNSYFYPFSAEQAAEVERLRQGIEHRIATIVTPDPAFEIELALCAMYQPLHRLAGFERLLEVPRESWSEELRPLLEIALYNPAHEQEIKPTIPAFGAIEDQVSQAVRSQYEENPYPRWTYLPQFKQMSFEVMLKTTAPWVELPAGFEEPTSCLIAGSGTGRHPISAAALMPQVAFQAVDLSLSSLAYAKRMAIHHGVENLEFKHGDLLEVGALGKQFDWIESCGVLHHMKEPERGLESLLRVLRPGGFMKLGLYSRLARHFIIEARERIATLGIEPTTENIREFRRRIVTGEEPHLTEFLKLGDFFDLDSFRDLVFHFQEHQFTISQIKDMLDRHDLDFCGFVGLRPTVYQAFSERFPGIEACTDLGAWTAFEEDNPSSFIGMYEFWVRHRS